MVRSDCLHPCNQSFHTKQVDQALHVVGQHVQTHLGTDARQGLHLEVRRAHPVFDGAVGMFHRLPAYTHALRFFVQAPLECFNYVLMFPARYTPVLARCALRLDRAARAG